MTSRKLSAICRIPGSCCIISILRTGIHERIFTAMLAGAVCVTSKYQLLERFFEDGKEIVTYPADAPEQLPVVIDELLSNPGRAAQIAAAGEEGATKTYMEAARRTDCKMDG